MSFFCFNDCFPKTFSSDLIVKKLTANIREYDKIKTRYNQCVGIITDRKPESIKLNASLTLIEAIDLLKRDERIIAYANFNKYPIDFFCETEDISLLERSFFVKIGEEKFDSLNLYITFQNSGILFTLGLNDELSKNVLNILEAENKYEILNQFGEDKNTNFILLKLAQIEIESKKGFEKFISLFENPIYNKNLRKDFESLPLDAQLVIIRELKEASDRNLETKFMSNGQTIKDVTPKSENQIKLFELRIFNPIALRLYFYETGAIVYLAKITRKPAKKTQNNDIDASIDNIKELIATH